MLALRRLVQAASLLTIVLLVLLSPVLMLLILNYPLPWDQLGAVGQAYGAISAVTSGVALLGVAVSLVIQQRHNRVAEEHTVRQRHFDLVRLTLEDLKFLYSWGTRADLAYDPALLGFSNLIVAHWLMLWQIGHIDEATLRANVRTFFNGQVGRDHWRKNAHTWPTTDHRARRFALIMTEEYERAQAAGPPVVIPPPFRSTDHRFEKRDPVPAGHRRQPFQKEATTAALGVIASIIVYQSILRRVRRRQS
jgi:hypothetical protein